MSKKLTQFESLLKERMADYEAPYDIKSWYGIDKRMNVHAKSNSPWIVALAATLVVSSAIGIGMYKYRNSPSEAMVVNTASERFHNASANNVRGLQFNQVQHSEMENLVKTNSIINGSTIKSSGNQELAHSNSVIVSNNQPAAINESTIVQPSSNKSLKFESSTREGCAGVEIDFKATNGPAGGSYLWNFGDGRFSKEANPKHQFNKPGKYDVSLSVTSNDGQISTAVLNDMIVIYPSPDANFHWKFINDNPDAATVEIINTSSNASNFEWKFEDGSTFSTQNPIKNVFDKGKHTVSLRVSNDFGCKDDAIRQISINSDINIGASATFYPEKEIFMPIGLKSKDSKFELTIYTLDNEIVYLTNSYSKGWNGKLFNGTTAQAGQYKWKVVLIGAQSEPKYFNGVFTVFP